MISGFTWVHDGISGGYPFVEAISAVRPYVDEVVAVDAESTDDTRRVLDKLCETVLTSPWSGRDTSSNAFLKHLECKGDTIIFFEADEVYDEGLLKEIVWYLARGASHLAVYRLQLEQNFQRCREYPIPVHRIFPKGQGTYHLHPTIYPKNLNVQIIPAAGNGYLWDCSGNFRDNWVQRKRNQSQIWGDPRHLMVSGHFAEPNEISEVREMIMLDEPHWTWTETPFKIPQILRKHLGQTKYEVTI